MTKQTFFKGLLMAVIATAVTYFSTPPIDYLMMAIAAVSTVLVYAGKNIFVFLRSDSPAWRLTLVNYLSGIFVAVGTGIVDGMASFLIAGAVDWSVLWKLVLSVTLTYLATTLYTKPNPLAKKK
jgi:hypothetical protein